MSTTKCNTSDWCVSPNISDGVSSPGVGGPAIYFFLPVTTMLNRVRVPPTLHTTLLADE